MSVTVKVLTDDVIKMLSELESHGNNLSGVMRSFGAYMEGSIQKNFDAEGRPEKWKPLSFSQKVAWHTKYKSFWNKSGGMSKKGKEAWAGRKVLTDTGRLRNSIRAEIMTNGVRIATGSNVEYAAVHQFGGKKTPARPYLMFQPEDIDYFCNLLNGYLLTGKIG